MLLWCCLLCGYTHLCRRSACFAACCLFVEHSLICFAMARLQTIQLAPALCARFVVAVKCSCLQSSAFVDLATEGFCITSVWPIRTQHWFILGFLMHCLDFQLVCLLQILAISVSRPFAWSEHSSNMLSSASSVPIEFFCIDFMNSRLLFARLPVEQSYFQYYISVQFSALSLVLFWELCITSCRWSELEVFAGGALAWSFMSWSFSMWSLVRGASHHGADCSRSVDLHWLVFNFPIFKFSISWFC